MLRSLFAVICFTSSSNSAFSTMAVSCLSCGWTSSTLADAKTVSTADRPKHLVLIDASDVLNRNYCQNLFWLHIECPMVISAGAALLCSAAAMWRAVAPMLFLI